MFVFFLPHFPGTFRERRCVVRGLRSLVEELCAALAVFDPVLVPGDECAALAEALTRTAKLCAVPVGGGKLQTYREQEVSI